MTFQIVFQHPDFIVINKPNGISVHKDDADIGLTRLVAQQLGVPQVWLVHRLDKVTSGLLMLALNEQGLCDVVTKVCISSNSENLPRTGNSQTKEKAGENQR